MDKKTIDDMTMDEIKEYLQRSEIMPAGGNGSGPISTIRNDYIMSQHDRKKINDAITRDQRYRLAVATETLPWTGRVKAWGSYLLTNGKAEYPRMSMIVDTIVRQMMEKADKLEGVVDSMVTNSNNLYEYGLGLIDRCIESQRIVMDSGVKRLEFREITESIEQRMRREDDIFVKLDCYRNKYIADQQYRLHNSLYMQHTVLGNLNMQQVQRVENMNRFVATVLGSSDIMLQTSKAMNEEIDHIKFVYDIVPDALHYELDIDEMRRKGVKLTEGYKPIHEGLMDAMNTMLEASGLRQAVTKYRR